MPASRTWTEEELMALPDKKSELVGGEIVPMNAAGMPHGVTLMRLGARLQVHVEKTGLGWLMDSSTGCWMPSGNMRVPDLSYVSRERLPESTPGFVRVVPDLVVEVLSPSDSRTYTASKIREYVEAGVRLTWLIDPERRTAEIHGCGTATRTIDADGMLDGEDVIPGFSVLLRDVLP